MARDRDDDRDDDKDDRDERPSRRRRDDDDDAPAQLGPLDKMFRDTNMVILVIFGICCSWIAAILGLVGMLTAKDPKAKKNATLVLIIGGVVGVIEVIVNVVASMSAAVAR